MSNHPSRSSEQQQSGGSLVHLLSRELGVQLRSAILPLHDGCTVQIDGFSKARRLMCEAWSHMGRPRGSQPDKVMSDALKLIFCEKSLGGSFRKILVFADEAAAKPFIGNSWQAACLRQQGIEVQVLALPDDLVKQISDAQNRQRMTNSEVNGG
jgi:hypothetical protein